MYVTEPEHPPVPFPVARERPSPLPKIPNIFQPLGISLRYAYTACKLCDYRGALRHPSPFGVELVR